MVGNGDALVNDVAPIEAAGQGKLTFLANPAYTEYLYTTGASVVILAADFVAEKALPEQLTQIRVADPRLAMSTLIHLISKAAKPAPGIAATAVVHPTASVGEGVYIGHHCVVEAKAVIGDHSELHAFTYVGTEAKIGSNTMLHPRVTVNSRCVVGSQCIIQSGAVVGADGFGFAPNSANEYQKVQHLGNVVIGDRVEIGACTSIDRATFGSTVIGNGVKLDNLIQIAHNVEIGENTVMAAQCGVAGSTHIGRNCMIGGQVGIVGHLRIANGVKIAAQSGIGSSILEEGKVVQGSPAMHIGDYKRAYVHFRNLAEIADRVTRLELAYQKLSD